jgi:Domain of unknown function (DUF3510)
VLNQSIDKLKPPINVVSDNLERLSSSITAWNISVDSSKKRVDFCDKLQAATEHYITSKRVFDFLERKDGSSPLTQVSNEMILTHELRSLNSLYIGVQSVVASLKLVDELQALQASLSVSLSNEVLTDFSLLSSSCLTLSKEFQSKSPAVIASCKKSFEELLDSMKKSNVATFLISDSPETFFFESSVSSLAKFKRGSEAVEAVIAEFVIYPVVNELLTPAKVDDGQRGSWRRFSRTCEDLVAYLTSETSLLSRVLGHLSRSKVDCASIDVLSAVVSQILAILDSNLPGWSSPALPSIFSQNYTAISHLISRLKVFGSQFMLVSSVRSSSITTTSTAFHSIADILTVSSLSPTLTSRSASANLLSSPACLSLRNAMKPKLAVYYTLRTSDIQSKVEKALQVPIRSIGVDDLSATQVSSSSTEQSSHHFLFDSSSLLFKQLSSMWASKEIVLPSLSPQFLSFSLGLLSKHLAFSQQVAEGGVSETLFPRTLENHVAAVSDLKELMESVKSEIIPNIASFFVTEGDAGGDKNALSVVNEVFAPIFEESHKVSRAHVEAISSLVSSVTTTALASMRSIPASYRMTNKPIPRVASPYVHSVLKPAKNMALFSKHLSQSDLGFVLASLSEKTAAAMLTLVLEVIEGQVGVDASVSWVKKQSGGAGAGPSDSDKVGVQLLLDATHIQVELQGLFHSYVEEAYSRDVSAIFATVMGKLGVFSQYVDA